MKDNENVKIEIPQYFNDIIEADSFRITFKDNYNSENNTTMNNYSKNLSNSTNESHESLVNLLGNEKINLYGNSIHIEHPYKLGSTYAYFYIKNYPIFSIGKYLFIPILFFLTVNLIFLATKFWLYEGAGVFLQSLFFYPYIVFIITYIYSTIINPGIPSLKYNIKNLNEIKKDKKKKKQYAKCKKCELIYKISDKVCHCKKCGICYYDLVQHSDFIGHCIAKNNKYVYFILIISLICFIPSSISMIIVNILNQVIKKRRK